MALKSITRTLTLLAAVAAVNAHSWVEQVRRIDSTGAFAGPVGYPINWQNRTKHGFNDHLAQNAILDKKPNPAICRPKAGSYDVMPRLTAAPGDYVALIYEENGHVTQPNLTPRPYRDGLVSVYGTMNHEDSDGINDVLNAWTADGKGGNGKGKLLGTHFYDDGQCYQNLGQNFAIPIYNERYHKQNGLSELFCQTDFQLPSDLPTNGIYTVMWVWDWPLIISDTQNTTEIYTSCAEIQLQPPQDGNNGQVKFSQNNPINVAAISTQLATQFEATGLGIGTSPPAAPSSTPGQGNANPADSSPVATTTSDSAPSSSKQPQSGVKTVTVTADAQTTTQWKTVTVGGTGRAEHTETLPTAVTTSSQSTSTSAPQAGPTSNIPVISVSKFLKARATGQARRDSDNQS